MMLHSPTAKSQIQQAISESFEAVTIARVSCCSAVESVVVLVRNMPGLYLYLQGSQGLVFGRKLKKELAMIIFLVYLVTYILGASYAASGPRRTSSVPPDGSTLPGPSHLGELKRVNSVPDLSAVWNTKALGKAEQGVKAMRQRVHASEMSYMPKVRSKMRNPEKLYLSPSVDPEGSYNEVKEGLRLSQSMTQDRKGLAKAYTRAASAASLADRPDREHRNNQKLDALNSKMAAVRSSNRMINAIGKARFYPEMAKKVQSANGPAEELDRLQREATQAKDALPTLHRQAEDRYHRYKALRKAGGKDTDSESE